MTLVRMRGADKQGKSRKNTDPKIRIGPVNLPECEKRKQVIIKKGNI